MLTWKIKHLERHELTGGMHPFIGAGSPLEIIFPHTWEEVKKYSNSDGVHKQDCPNGMRTGMREMAHGP